MKRLFCKCLLFMALAVMMLVPMTASATAEEEDVQVIRPYIAGAETVGTELTGKYTYYDYDNQHGENGTTFRWLRSDEKTGTYTAISGATGINYTLTAQDAGKYLKFEVTPKSIAKTGLPCASWMIGPVLTQAEAAKINNYFTKGDNYMNNVNAIQAEIQERLAGAVYFTIDAKGNVNDGNLHGSEFLYKNNIKFPFRDSTKPIVKDGTAYAPAGFFIECLGAEVPESVSSITENERTYYDLKEGTLALGKKFWSGDENQYALKNFQLQHLGQGLVVISDQENIFDPVADRDLIDEACNELYTLRATEEQMEWWRAAKYGLFLHWDPSSIRGVEISWDRAAARPRDVGGSTSNDPIDKVYDTQYKSFDPVNYDADEWMEFAKEAGVKYLVLTTKHHGSFSNFDSQFDNYTIANTPYGKREGKEIVRQYVDAAHRAGLRVGFYYSARDWYNPSYLTADHHRYLEYYFGQIQELLTNYGDVDIMWFDSIGENSMNQWDARTLLRRMKQLQPDIVVNNRFMAELANYDRAPYDINGDWYTPEHRLGGFDASRPWESCMAVTTVKGGGWSYRPNAPVKTVEESVKFLINNVVNDGNLLYDIGPMSDGTFDERHAKVFKDVGAWLKPYEEAIFNTRGGPYNNPNWGGSTYRKNDDGTQTIYLHVTRLLHGSSPSGKSLQIAAPSNGQTYNSATLVKKGSALDGAKVTLVKNSSGYQLTLPDNAQWEDYDTVIKLNADVKTTLTGKIAEAKQCAEKMTAAALGKAKENLLNKIAAAEAIVKDAGSSSAALSEQLVIINDGIALAESDMQLNTLINSSTEKLETVAVGDEEWECPQILINNLKQSLETAKGYLEDMTATNEQIQDVISEINAQVGSIDGIMSSLKVVFTPGRSDGQGTYTMTSGFPKLQIRYTLDKSEPTKDSTLYEGTELPIFGKILAVKAALFDENGKKVSDTCEQIYFNASGLTNIAADGTTVTASSIYNDTFNAKKACDNNKETRWATPDGTVTATLTVDFGTEKTVNTALIQEYLSEGEAETTRISNFAIEYWDAGAADWKEAMTGTQGGESRVFTFEPVTSTKVRLNIKGCMNVTIWEFGLYNLEDSVALVKDSDTLYPNGAIRLGMSGIMADGSVISQDEIKNITYHTDREDLVSISSVGKLRLKEGVVLTKDETVNVWAAGTVSGQEKTTERQSITLSLNGKDLALNQKASASSVNSAQYAAGKAVDGNRKTRWASTTEQSEYWLEVDFDQPTPFERVNFKVYSDKNDAQKAEILKTFKIQTWDGEKWVDTYDSSAKEHAIVYPVYDGSETYVGGAWVDSKDVVKSTDYSVDFERVTAEKIRLYSNEVLKDPSIYEFSVYDNQGTVNLPDIEKVEAADIEVPYGTKFADLELPEKVSATMDDDSVMELNVVWQQGGYDGDTAGSYALEGVLTINDTITNTKNLKAHMNVIVQKNGFVLDKKPLEDKIAEAKAILPEDYTEESYDALQLAIEKAEAVLKTVTTQLEVTNAVNELQAAIDALSVILPDVSKVEAAADIEVAYGTTFESLPLPEKAKATLDDGTKRELNVTWQRGDYDGNKADSYALEGILAIDDTITNTKNLKVQINVIVKEKVIVLDKKPLEDKIAEAKAILPDGYTKESYDALQLEIGKAEAALDTVTTQEQITLAVQNLQNAIDSLVEIVVPPIKDIESAEALTGREVGFGTKFEDLKLPEEIAVTFTDQSTDTLQVRWLEEGYNGEVAGEYTLTGEISIDENIMSNSHGIAASIVITVLKEIPVEPTLDTKALEAVIQKAEAVQTGIYTGKSYQALKDSIFSAKAVLANPVTQEEIDKAAAGLEARIKELVKIPEVVRAAALPAVKVPYGTSFEKVVLPNRVVITLSDGTQVLAGIEWSAGNYNGAMAGTYILPGSLRISGEVKNSGNVKAVINVTVEKEIQKVINPSKVSLNYRSITMKKGTKFTWLKAVVSPRNAANKKVTWKSSNKKVAVVDRKGVIKAKRTGNAKITVRTANNKTRVVKVRVVNRNIAVSKITLKKKITVVKGRRVRLSASISPINAANKKVTWVSSDPKKAKISSKGTLTAKKTGRVKITCRAKDGSKKKAVCWVTISPK